MQIKVVCEPKKKSLNLHLCIGQSTKKGVNKGEVKDPYLDQSLLKPFETDPL